VTKNVSRTMKAATLWTIACSKFVIMLALPGELKIVLAILVSTSSTVCGLRAGRPVTAAPMDEKLLMTAFIHENAFTIIR
jgi:hypothetical protein